MKKLNYKRMVKDIDKLVSDEFVSEMEMKTLPPIKPYTQAEAEKMNEIIGAIYLISHCVHCSGCDKKYKL